MCVVCDVRAAVCAVRVVRVVCAVRVVCDVRVVRVVCAVRVVRVVCSTAYYRHLFCAYKNVSSGAPW